MGIFSKNNNQENETKSVEEIQESLNWYASSNNGSTTAQVDALQDQLDEQGYEAVYVPGYNTYKIEKKG